MARSRLIALIAEADGDVRPNAAVYVLERGGTSATTDQVAESIYTTADGLTPAVQPLTSDATTGILDAYMDGKGKQVTLAYGAVIADAAFDVDPGAALLTSVKSYRAVGDGKITTNALVSSGVAELRMADTSLHSFSAADVGKVFTIDGGAAASAPLQGTITSFITTTRVGISVTPAANVSGQWACWGTDDTTALQTMAAAIYVTGAAMTLPHGIYIVTESIVFQRPWVRLEGIAGCDSGPGVVGATTIVAIGSGFTNDTVFGICTDDTLILPSAIGFNQGSHVSHIHFINGNDYEQLAATTFNLAAIRSATAGMTIQQCIFDNWTQAVVTLGADAGGNPVTNDRFLAERGTCKNQRNFGTLAGSSASANYQFEINGGSDEIEFSQWQNYGGNFIMASNTLSGIVSNCGGGTTFLTRCSSWTIRNCHYEGEPVVTAVDVKTLAIRDCFIQPHDTDAYSVPIRIWRTRDGGGVGAITTPDENGSSVTLDGLDIKHFGDPSTNSKPDVLCDSEVTLHVRGCMRRYTVGSGDNSIRSPYEGLIIADTIDSVEYPAWKRQAGMFSRNATLSKEVVDWLHCFGGLAATATIGSIIPGGGTAGEYQWVSASGTYSYWVDVLYDPTRLIGMTSNAGATSIALTINGSIPVIILAAAVANLPCTLRVWRWEGVGTTPSVYVDVPLSGGVSYLRDTGQHLHGRPWVSTGTNGLGVRRSQIFNCRILVGSGMLTCLAWAGAAPVAGIWTIGDHIKHSAPNSGSPKGWFCTVSGKAHAATTGNTNSNTTIDTVSQIADWAIGDSISGTNIPAGTTVTGIDTGASAFTISQAATGTTGGVSLFDAVFVSEGNL